MLLKDVPILLVYAVSAFTASNGGKFERTMNIGLSVCDVLHGRPMCRMDEQGVFLWLATDEAYPHDHEIGSNNAG